MRLPSWLCDSDEDRKPSEPLPDPFASLLEKPYPTARLRLFSYPKIVGGKIRTYLLPDIRALLPDGLIPLCAPFGLANDNDKVGEPDLLPLIGPCSLLIAWEKAKHKPKKTPAFVAQLQRVHPACERLQFDEAFLWREHPDLAHHYRRSRLLSPA